MDMRDEAIKGGSLFMDVALIDIYLKYGEYDRHIQAYMSRFNISILCV